MAKKPFGTPVKVAGPGPLPREPWMNDFGKPTSEQIAAFLERRRKDIVNSRRQFFPILYDAQAGNDYCNGKLAPINPNDPSSNLKECLHLDDVLKALPAEVPDTSKG